MESPKAFSTFSIDEDFINQWFDSFHPSIRTHTIDFAVNTMKRYDFNPDVIKDEDEKSFAIALANHFAAFLKLKAMDQDLDA
jgi:hypothetical protein